MYWFRNNRQWFWYFCCCCISWEVFLLFQKCLLLFQQFTYCHSQSPHQGLSIVATHLCTHKSQFGYFNVALFCFACSFIQESLHVNDWRIVSINHWMQNVLDAFQWILFLGQWFYCLVETSSWFNFFKAFFSKIYT